MGAEETSTTSATHVVRGSALDWLRSFGDGEASALITDPPYSSGGTFRGDRASANTNRKYVNKHYPQIAGDSRDQRSWRMWCEGWLREALRVVKPEGVAAVFCDWRQLPTLSDAFQIAGWVQRGIFVWDKTEGTRPQLGRFRAQCEYVVWGSHGPLPLDRDAPCLPGAITVPVLGREKEHPTEKPVDMLRVLARFCERDGLVIDPFAGTGALGVACVREGRRYQGCELVAHYATMADARVRDAVQAAHDRPALFDAAELIR